MSRHSTPPMAPSDIITALRSHFREIPIDHIVQRNEREQGKQARIEASQATVELKRWREGLGK